MTALNLNPPNLTLEHVILFVLSDWTGEEILIFFTVQYKLLVKFVYISSQPPLLRTTCEKQSTLNLGIRLGSNSVIVV